MRMLSNQNDSRHRIQIGSGFEDLECRRLLAVDIGPLIDYTPITLVGRGRGAQVAGENPQAPAVHQIAQHANETVQTHVQNEQARPARGVGSRCQALHQHLRVRFLAENVAVDAVDQHFNQIDVLG
ncbi:MAG: hypothetical protein KDB27_29200 [Planctomycetales bacterium]|nr:hypothetical protein [Planctomycetales bacterium]